MRARGGENRRAPRGVFVPLRGRDLASSRPGRTGTVRRDIPGSAGALGSPISSFRHPHPHSSRPWSQVTGLLLPHPFTHPPPTASTQRPSSLGWGRRDGGEGARWAEYLLKGGCLLWNVDFFLCPRNCFPLWAPILSHSPQPPASFPFNSMNHRRKMSATLSHSGSSGTAVARSWMSVRIGT